MSKKANKENRMMIILGMVLHTIMTKMPRKAMIIRYYTLGNDLLCQSKLSDHMLKIHPECKDNTSS